MSSTAERLGSVTSRYFHYSASIGLDVELTVEIVRVAQRWFNLILWTWTYDIGHP